MKKFLVVFLLGLLIAGTAFAQVNSGYAQPAQPVVPSQTISGTLQIINGTLAIVTAASQVFYVPNLQPFFGANGLCINAFVTVYGTIAGNCCYLNSFMTGGRWYILPGYNCNVPPVQQAYGPPIVMWVVPMYAPPQSYYPRYYGW